jgi:hypothetical protein
MKRLLAISLLALLPPSLYAQAAHGFQPGQTISWQDRISGKWQSGTYIGATPGDRQPIIQQRPGEPGSQTAYEWDKISRTPPPAPGAAPAAGGKGMKPGAKNSLARSHHRSVAGRASSWVKLLEASSPSSCSARGKSARRPRPTGMMCRMGTPQPPPMHLRFRLSRCR